MSNKEVNTSRETENGRTDLPKLDIPGLCYEMMIVARCGIWTGLALLTIPPLAAIPIIKGIYHFHKAGTKLG